MEEDVINILKKKIKKEIINTKEIYSEPYMPEIRKGHIEAFEFVLRIIEKMERI